MEFNIRDKVAIVTGAGRGIGRACALELAREGVHIGINDIDEEVGNAVTAEIKSLGVDAIFVKGDVSVEKDVKSIFQIVYEKFGQIDILINNAGISPKPPFYEITEEMFMHVLEVNLKSGFLCTKEAFDYMKDNNWGRIVSLSSMAGVYGGANSSVHYAASKAGIIGMTKTFAKQLGKYNITVNCVAPGRINTAMTDMLSEDKKREALSRIPLGRFGSAEEVADVVVFLASERGSYITGTCVEILGGYVG